MKSFILSQKNQTESRKLKCVWYTWTTSYDNRKRNLQALLKVSILCFIGIFLSGCSVFKPLPRPSIYNYELTAEPSQPFKVKPTQFILFVNTTQTGPGYETTGIAYSKSPYQLDYFAKNRWVAPPAQLINKALVSAFQQSHLYKAIATTPYVGQHDFRLDTRLLELKQDVTRQPHLVIFTMSAQLIDTKRQSIVASKQFTVRTTSAMGPNAAVMAANKALSQMLDQLITFCVHHSAKK